MDTMFQYWVKFEGSIGWKYLTNVRVTEVPSVDFHQLTNIALPTECIMYVAM